MKSIIKKQPFNPSMAFDDSSLSQGPAISAKRSQEIEDLLLPQLMAEFEKLRTQKQSPFIQRKSR
jgi:hypothetical protein